MIAICLFPFHRSYFEYFLEILFYTYLLKKNCIQSKIGINGLPCQKLNNYPGTPEIIKYVSKRGNGD